jgi:hypothetical protein
VGDTIDLCKENLLKEAVTGCPGLNTVIAAEWWTAGEFATHVSSLYGASPNYCPPGGAGVFVVEDAQAILGTLHCPGLSVMHTDLVTCICPPFTTWEVNEEHCAGQTMIAGGPAVTQPIPCNGWTGTNVNFSQDSNLIYSNVTRNVQVVASMSSSTVPYTNTYIYDENGVVSNVIWSTFYNTRVYKRFVWATIPMVAGKMYRFVLNGFDYCPTGGTVNSYTTQAILQ